jgi:Dyp-type peroxidase family
MPLNLDSDLEPIDQNEATYQDFLKDLQGNILNGHGRDHAVHIFLTFISGAGKRTEVKTWIADFASKITSAKGQLDASEEYKCSKTDAGLFSHFALSASGYDYLEVPKNKQPHGSKPQERDDSVADRFGNPAPFYADSFQDGLKSRQEVLLDPPVENWEDGFKGPIDALIILADDNPADLSAAELEVRKQLKAIATIKTVEAGLILRRKFEATVNEHKATTDGSGIQREFGNVVEHFGYADGVSQPIFLKKKLEGVTSKHWQYPGAPLKLVLIDDPNGTPSVSFGSFLVFRKLEQNVKGFKTAEAKLAEKLGLPKELGGAMAVGRYEDGTPLVLQSGDDGWAESDKPIIPNDFNYDGDPDGLKCPFHAHVRKSNPRLESVGSFAKDADQELGHRIARRGITYGGPLSAADDLDDLPEKGVGLLFMCYQSDIWEQFEFIQRFWCNNPNFLEPGKSDITKTPANPNYDKTGLDAVIGQKQGKQFDPVIGEAPQPPQNWPQEWGKSTVKPAIETENQFGQFVTLKGGEYFFSPSITFLRNLPSLTFDQEDQSTTIESGIESSSDLEQVDLVKSA